MIRAQITTDGVSTSELPLVMVVDDDVFFGQLIQDVLDEYQVVLCTDAVMALEQLDELTPQAMIIDLLKIGRAHV